MARDALTRVERRRSLTAVLASAAVAGASIGMTLPLLSLVMEHDGVSPTVIGLNTATGAAAVLMIGPWMARIMARLGTLATIVAGIAFGLVPILLFPVLHTLTAWFVLRFVLGIGVCLAWIASETWIVGLATTADRGRIMGLYNTLWAGGFAAGPLVLGLVGSEGVLPFLVCAGLMAATGAPLALARGLAPAIPARSKRGIRHAITAAPTIFAAALISGFAEVAIFALLPVYGLRVGFDEAAAVAMLSALVVGGVALQMPLGWLADRIDRRRLLAYCAVAAAAGAVLTPVSIDAPVVLGLVLFLWGGAVFGLYTVGIIRLGERFAGATLAGANAAFVMTYEVGTLSGPMIAGGGMDLWDPHGLMVVLGLATIGFVALFLRRRRPAHSGDE